MIGSWDWALIDANTNETTIYSYSIEAFGMDKKCFLPDLQNNGETKLNDKNTFCLQVHLIMNSYQSVSKRLPLRLKKSIKQEIRQQFLTSVRHIYKHKLYANTFEIPEKSIFFIFTKRHIDIS